jgi:hypothetical protein
MPTEGQMEDLRQLRLDNARDRINEVTNQRSALSGLASAWLSHYQMENIRRSPYYDDKILEVAALCPYFTQFNEEAKRILRQRNTLAPADVDSSTEPS